MKLRKLTARVWPEGAWWVAQAIEVDVASQGRTKEEARRNLEEALELYFEPDLAAAVPTDAVRVEIAGS